LGLIDPEGIYRLEYDFSKSLGIDAGRYLKSPTPNALYPDILVEEAINEIMNGQLPQGRPAEGAQMHYAKLLDFLKSDELGHFGTTVDAAHMELLKKWIEIVRNMVISDQQKQQMMQAAQQFQKNHGQEQQGQPMQGGQQGQAPLQPNELLDETLPTSGGGQNG
jgi:hypothetical protein